MARKRTKHMRIPNGKGIKILLGVEILLCLYTVIGIGVAANLGEWGNNISKDWEEFGPSAILPLMFGLSHALYVFGTGRLVKKVYPKWRGYAIGTAAVLSLGAAIVIVSSSYVKNFALVCAGFAIIFAAMLLLCAYHFKTSLGKRFALTYNQLLDAGYFDELERRKKADVERETAVIIETAENAANEMRVPGKRVEPVKSAAPSTRKGPNAVLPVAMPSEPAKAVERKPESGEEKPKPTGHTLKL